MSFDHDFCNEEGARRLKERIEEYWWERGYVVDVKLVEAGFVAAMRSARTDTRSDMLNGYPRSLAEAVKANRVDKSVLEALRPQKEPRVASFTAPAMRFA